MMLSLRKFLLTIVLISMSGLSFTALAKSEPLWEATFSNVMPNHSGITTDYCLSHSPNQYQTTVTNAVKKGMLANNGVRVKYQNFSRSKHYGVVFVSAHVLFSGIENNKPWRLKTILYGFRLVPTATQGFFINHDCKGEVSAKMISAGA